MEILTKLSNAFWNEDVWLPPNITWKDIEPGSREDIIYADYRHLLWPIPISFLIIILRIAVENYWIMPIGRSLGIKSTKAKAPIPNKTLEITYSKMSKLNHKTIVNLTKQLDLTERQIERWWRRRKAQDKPTTLKKFCENVWRCMYYTYSFIFGIIVMWDKSWLWDIKQCWYSYPHQSIHNDVWWYYMISMAFYWSLTFSQFLDNKRKDFWQMFIHHVLTLVLISLSWMCNLHRVGSLVLIVHDFADILLEAAKFLKYANLQKACDIIFGLFTISWIVTRLGLFPRIIYSSTVEAPQILPMYPVYYIFNSLLIMLLVLHFIWTYMILQVVVQTIKAGQMEGDVRSSSDEVSDSSENRDKPVLQNGSTTPLKDNNKSSPSRLISNNIEDD
jgi:ceramide synthetase